jgi:hypothetical protein
MFGSLDIKTYRHILHPSSKLVVNLDPEKVSHQRETMKVDRSKNSSRLVNDYKLTTRKHSYLIEKEKFIKSNSLGPNGYIRKLVEV